MSKDTQNGVIDTTKKSITKDEIILDYIRKTLSVVKNIPLDKFKADKNNIKIAEVEAKTPNGTIIKCAKVQTLPSKEELFEVSLIAQVNNITLNDLILQRYYLMPINGKTILFKKYTTIMREFHEENPNIFIEFELKGDFLECIAINRDTDKQQCKTFVLVNEFSAGKGLSQLERAKIGAMKNLMRFNYPKYVDFYDEYDQEIILQNSKETAKPKVSELLEKAKAEIGAE